MGNYTDIIGKKTCSTIPKVVVNQDSPIATGREALVGLAPQKTSKPIKLKYEYYKSAEFYKNSRMSSPPAQT